MGVNEARVQSRTRGIVARSIEKKACWNLIAKGKVEIGYTQNTCINFNILSNQDLTTDSFLGRAAEI